MRTTVRLNADLMAQVKKYATQKGQTITKVITEALQMLLVAKQTAPKNNNFKLLTFKGKGTQQGIDLDDTSSLYDIMDNKT